MMDIKSLLLQLKSIEDQEKKYEILIKLARQKPDFPTQQKIKANLIPNCTVRIWSYQGEVWSDSRMINALLIVIQNSEFNDIKSLLDYYNINEFYSTLRVKTLSLLIKSK